MGSEAISYMPPVSIPVSEDSVMEVDSRSKLVPHSARQELNKPARVEEADEEVLQSVATGSREALSILFRRYARAVFVLVSRVLRDSAEAEDLVQEVFLLLFDKAKLFDPSKGSAASWILRIAYLRALDRRKYLGVRQHYTVQPIDSERLYATQGNVSIDEIEGRRLLAKLRNDLTTEQRETLELHFFEGYSFPEIAEKTHQTVGNVRNHYYRGLSRLRALVFTENSHSK